MGNKTQRSFTINKELDEELDKVENASEIVNQLLNTYFFDKHFKEKTLEEKVKELDELQQSIFDDKQKELQKVLEEKDKIEEKTRELMKQQKEVLEKDISAIESNKELCEQFYQTYLLDPTIVDDGLKLIEWVEKYRQIGLKIGSWHLRQYIKYKQGLL